MRNFIVTLFVAAAAMCGLQAHADTYSTDPSALPQTARGIIEKSFPKAEIGMIKTDTHILGTDDYEVKFTDGSEIEFDSKGDWSSVDCVRRAVPQEFVPKAISNYVKTNLRGVAIVKIERNRYGYEIELADGVEVKFDKECRFRSVDMN